MARALGPLAAVLALAVLAALAWGLLGSRGGGIEVSEEKAVVLPGGIAGVYMTITNNYGEEVCIVGVELRSHPGARAEIHQTRAIGERVEMVPVERLCIPPESSVRLKPGGYHIMVTGLGGSASLEDNLVMDLILDNGDRIEVIVEVSAAKIPE